MDGLLPAFVAVLLAETGGAIQKIFIGRAGPDAGRSLALLAVSTLLSLGVACAGAAIIGPMLGERPRALMAGLALLFAGVPMLLPDWRQKKAPMRISRFDFAKTQFGDASQFIVFAFGARGSMPWLALAGGFAGIMIAAVLPVLLGKDWPSGVPMVLMHKLAGWILALAGLWQALMALQLI